MKWCDHHGSGIWSLQSENLLLKLAEFGLFHVKPKIVTKVLVDTNCILWRAKRHESEKTTSRSQLLRHNQTDPVLSDTRRSDRKTTGIIHQMLSVRVRVRTVRRNKRTPLSLEREHIKLAT